MRSRRGGSEEKRGKRRNEGKREARGPQHLGVDGINRAGTGVELTVEGYRRVTVLVDYE